MESKELFRTSWNTRENIVWEDVQSTLRNQLKPFGCFGSNFVNRHMQHVRYLSEMIRRTSLMGESNSILIIGPRGSGKSALLECVQKTLFEDSAIHDNIISVVLNGLIHTDDHIALKDIIRQLQLENTDEKITGSFAEKFTYVLAALNSGSQKNKSVLFVLDEFDLFCHHKKQTLLLNLFDVAQSQQLPICVIGLTCRTDVIQLLEKRVKSRFTHRQINFLEKMEFSEYVEIAKDALSLPQTFGNKEFKERWNKHVEVVIEGNVVMDVLKRHYEWLKNIRYLKQMLVFPVSLISKEHPTLEPGDFVDAFSFCSLDSKAAILQGLSLLEISLVVAMMHLSDIFAEEPFNFEMVYREYQKFSQKKTMLQNVNKAVVLKAFERLQEIELIKAVGGSTNHIQKRYKLMRFLVESSDIKAALQRYQNMPFQLRHWASSILADI